MALPLLLAGPILRRVESNLVTVWLALSEPAKVSLVVYEGIAVAAGRDPVPHQHARGHVAARRQAAPRARHRRASPRPPARACSPTPSTPTTSRSSPAAPPTTWRRCNMLRDATPPRTRPTATPTSPSATSPTSSRASRPCPSKLTDVRILYGSCRLPSCRDPDALAYVDDYIHDHVQDPRSRPHQLILGGDQVYADDVDTLMMIGLIELAGELIGVNNPSDPTERNARRAAPRRQGPAPHRRRPATPTRSTRPRRTRRTPRTPASPRPTAGCPPTPRRSHPATASSSPSAPRSSRARTARNHVLSFGEFAALYLLVWSNACWTNEIPGTTFVPDATTDTYGDDPATVEVDLEADAEEPHRPAPARVPRARLRAPLPAARPVGQTRQAHGRPEGEGRGARGAQAPAGACAAATRSTPSSCVGLPKVQRALANVPTYMMLDDHEITDDLFLSPTWRDRVLSSSRSACRCSTTACSPTPCSRTGATTRCATTAGCPPSCAPGPSSCSRPAPPPARRRRRSSGCRCCSATTCATTPTASAASAAPTRRSTGTSPSTRRPTG